jgi:hypothetical protein
MRGLRPLDFLAFVLALALFAGSLSLASASSGATPALHIESGDRSWVYPLDTDIELDIPGPLGVTHVQIQGSQAWVSESPCREKICISMGHIDQSGAWIACLPNRVFLRIEGAQAEVDALAR